MKKISTFLFLLLTLALLQGCHGGSSSSNTQNTVRLINDSNNSLDLFLSTSTQTNTALATAVAYGAASKQSNINSGISTISLNNTGSGVSSYQTSFSFSTGVDYALLAYMSSTAGTSGQSLHVAALTEDEIAPATGDGKLRIADLSVDAGNLDVYMAVQNNSLSDVYAPASASTALRAASTLVTNISGTTSFFEIPKGTYHIWVTGSGDITDLRLDIPSITISDQQIQTLALTSSAGGVLLDGIIFTQPYNAPSGATLTPISYKNTYARLRVATNENISSATATSSGGTVSIIGSALTAPSVGGTYSLIPAGTPLALTVNGAANVFSFTATPGTDYTLLDAGSAGVPQFSALTDDNTRPTNGSAKLRLVNGIPGSPSLSLTYDFIQVAPNVAFGRASTTTSVTSNISTSLAVNALYTASPVTLQSQGVYSVFMLGTNSVPVGILNKDH